MRKIELTPEQTDYLVQHFGDMEKKQLAAHLGISLPTLYRLAHALQLDLPGQINKIRLSPDQMDWLVKHFKDRENEFLAFKLGISETSLHRLARRYGLQKSRSFLKARSQDGGRTSIYYHRKRDDGFMPKKGDPVRPGSEKGWFRPGEKPVDRLGKRREAERIRKSAASRKATRLNEVIRLRRGLPQLTRLRIRTLPKEAYIERYYLLKRGYILDDAQLVAYWTPDTLRCPRKEANPGAYRFEQAV
jgi:hypothetical protein